MKSGSPTRARTWDLRINSPSLYQLSYRGFGLRKQNYSVGACPVRASAPECVARNPTEAQESSGGVDLIDEERRPLREEVKTPFPRFLALKVVSLRPRTSLTVCRVTA